MTSIDDALPRVLAEACEQVRLDDRDARIIRIGTNALFEITDPSIVVRIGLRDDAFRIAELELQVAEWLEAERLPAARPFAGIAQPLRVGGHPVTFWRFIPSGREPPTLGELGDVLRRLHALPTPRFDLPPFDPVRSTEALLARPDCLDHDSVSYLREECEELTRAYRRVAFDLPVGPIHGDAHTGNLVRSNGRAILIDFETFAIGPREWELVPTAVQLERFGLSEADYRRFAGAYGFDVRVWPGYPVLRRIREVAITAWLLRAAPRQPDAADEFRSRVAALRGEGDGRIWRRF